MEFFSLFKSKTASKDKKANDNITPTPSDNTLERIARIKYLIDQPKEAQPELRFSEIKKNMNAAVCRETVRIERWDPTVHCPYCSSTNVYRLEDKIETEEDKYKYHCRGCNKYFNDDTDTPFEGDQPPLSVWMQCWYLMGCTTSTKYIASKLGLDIIIVEQMIEELKRCFKANHPLTKLKSKEEWQSRLNQLYKQKEQAYQERGRDLLFGESINAPRDTAEHRKQKEKREDPTISPRTPKKH